MKKLLDYFSNCTDWMHQFVGYSNVKKQFFKVCLLISNTISRWSEIGFRNLFHLLIYGELSYEETLRRVILDKDGLFLPS